MDYRIYGRDRELEALRTYARLGKKVLIKGRRGIGKTYLVKALVELLIGEDKRAIYVNCEKVTTPASLLVEAGVGSGRGLSPDQVLETLFNRLREENIDLIVLDEFVYLVRDFARRKPYRSVERVVAHLRGLLAEFPDSVIFTASTLWQLYKLIRNYERRLARMFDVVMKLDSLRLDDASRIAYDVVKNHEEAVKIAELGDCVPFYVESIALTRLRCGDPYEAFVEELRRGALNELFRALFSNMPGSAREIICILAERPHTFEGLEHKIMDDTMPYSLEYLTEMDIIGRIQRRRRVTYYIKDKTFGAWVTMRRHPHIVKNIHRITRLLSLGFESIVRELFLSITTETELEDIKGERIAFGPTETVRRIELDGGELDLLATDEKGRTILGEVALKADLEKIKQLEENSAKIRKRMGLRDITIVLITYDRPSEQIIRLAEKKNIRILSSEQLNKLARSIGYRNI